MQLSSIFRSANTRINSNIENETIFSNTSVKEALEKLQHASAAAPFDEATNNVSFIGKIYRTY